MLSADGARLAVGAVDNNGANGGNSGHARVFDVSPDDCFTLGVNVQQPTASPTTLLDSNADILRLLPGALAGVVVVAALDEALLGSIWLQISAPVLALQNRKTFTWIYIICN